MANKVTISSDNSNISVTQEATKIIQVNTVGPQGPQGPPGSETSSFAVTASYASTSVSSSFATFAATSLSSSYATYAATSNGSSTASLALRAQRVDILNTSGDTELGLLFRAGDSNPGLVYADSQVATPSWNPSTNVMVVPYLSASNDLYVSGTLSIPGFSDVSASLANISFSETASYASNVQVNDIDTNGFFPITLNNNNILYKDNNPDFVYNPSTNTLVVNNIIGTSSLSTTSSFAITASYVLNGDTTDISALNTFTGSIQTKVDNLTAATSSYLTGTDLAFTGSYVTNSQTSSMSVSSASHADSASYILGSNVNGTVSAASIAASAINATNATNVDINNVSGDTNYGLVFRSTNANGNQPLYADNEIDQPAYNPSTNTITTPIISASNALYVNGNINSTTITSSLINIGILDRPLKIQGGTSISATYPKLTGIGGRIDIDSGINLIGEYKLSFDNDTTNTYIAANSNNPEDLEIHADQDIILNPDNQVIVNSNISSSGIVYGKTGSFSHLQGNSPITIADQVTFLTSSDFGNNSIRVGSIILEGTTFNSASFASSNQTLTFNQINNTLSISNGNTVDLSYLASGSGTPSGSSIWSTGSDYYYVNSNLQVTGSFSVNGIGSFSTLSGSLDWGYLENIPGNIISSSAQITNLGFISESADLSALNTFTGSIQTEVNTLTAATSSYITESTDISSLNTFTGSIQTEVDTLTAATSSYLTEVPAGTVSGSSQVSFDEISNVPVGLVSSSAQITINESQISDLSHTDISSINTFTGSIQTEVDTLTASTSSYLTSLPAGTISSSAQITITEAQISDLSHTNVSSLNTFTGSIQTEVNILTAATSSYLTGPIATSSIIDFNTEVSRSAAEAGFGTSGGVVGDNLGNHTASLDLDMGGNDITNVGNIDGVDVSTLKSNFDTLEGKTLISSSDQILPITTASITNFPTEVSRSAAAAGFGTGGGGGSGTVTEVTVGTGLDVTNSTTTPNVTLDLTEVIDFDGNNRILTSNGNGTITAETLFTISSGVLTLDGDVVNNGTISGLGIISASAFSGDGSGLTGTSGTPFPYTGSAAISGSLVVTGSLEVSETFNINSNITASGDFKIEGSLTASSISATNIDIAGGGVPTITSDSNLNLSASNAVVVKSPLLRLTPTTTGSVTAQNGDIIYDSNDNKFYGYANGAWVAFH